MASHTDEAERRIREQRALIQRKVADLEGRVGDDVSHARERIQGYVSNSANMVPGGSQLIDQVEQHPFVAMAGGLGVGVAAGMMGGRDSHRQRADVGHDRNGGASMAGLVGMLSTNLVSPLRPYVEDAAKQMIAGFADRQRGNASGAARASSQGEGDRGEATRE
ncbi:MAG: hypothetical protein AB7F65_00075 [Dehalococcoidia bacterium]